MDALALLTVEDGQSLEDARKLGPRLDGRCDMVAFKNLDMPDNVIAAIG
jgi:hypothetical protein